MGPAGTGKPYEAVTPLLDQNQALINATRMGHVLGVDPMEILRADETEWHIRAAMFRRAIADHKARTADAKG